MCVCVYMYVSSITDFSNTGTRDGNCTRMLWAILNKSWKQHPTKQQLYSHLPPISKTIQIRQTKHAEHCWRNKNKLISNILWWSPSHGCASVEWPSRTYQKQLCTDTGCGLENLPEVMDDRGKWRERERVRDIHASSTTWWLYIYIRMWFTIFINKKCSISVIEHT